MNMEFKYDDYLKVFSGRSFIYRQIFTPIRSINPEAMARMAESAKKFGTTKAFRALKNRLSQDYFYKMYPAQCASMSYSRSAFPPYRFILPDVLADDWLALVDYHKDFCRDHSIHQPLTAYIVHRLLGGGDESKSLIINGESILKRAVDVLCTGIKTEYLRDYLRQMMPHSRLFSNDKVARHLWKDLLYETAITAALFHDTGYPWQYVGRLRGSIGKNDFNLPVEDLNARHIYNTFRTRLMMYPLHGYTNPIYNTPAGWEKQILDMIKEAVGKTHGFPGALGFLYLNDLVRKSPSPSGEEMAMFSIDWAALGIMMHDMVKIYQGNENIPKNSFLRIDFERDPLSCIIAMADVLEDFYRPTASFRPVHGNNNAVNIDYDIAAQKTEINVNGDVMEVTYHFGTGAIANAQRQFKQKEIIDYFDEAFGYIDINSLGLSRVKCKCGV